mgnify:CR=1 FL=1
MLFNSPEFLLFLPIVFALYWFVVQRHLRAQNLLLVLASYVFYGWWDWRFLGLIAFSTLVDYLVGLQIEGAQEKRAKKEEKRARKEERRARKRAAAAVAAALIL